MTARGREQIVVFLGPTLSKEEAASVLDATYLPPAAQGDVYRASRASPLAIGIVDGFFERMPSVWHKEILWAMSRGVHVFGSASMGALRAAELEAFGMVGVGAVFGAFQSGDLEDDDEVAVAHAPAEQGYRQLSEAMVDIRRTLKDAVAAEALRQEEAAAFVDIGKSLFYAERSYEGIAERALAAGMPLEVVDRLRVWLGRGKASQKREDALEMLELLRSLRDDGPQRKSVTFTFQHTGNWDLVVRQNRGLGVDLFYSMEGVAFDALHDEFRLQGVEKYERITRAGLLRFLALDDASRHDVGLSEGYRASVREEFLRERGLLQEEAAREWMHQNDLSAEEFDRLVDEEAKLRWVGQTTHMHALSHVANHLRASGDYREVVERLVDKNRVLSARGLSNVGLQALDLTEEKLIRWYFEEHQSGSVPDDVAAYCTRLGFEDRAHFVRTVLREYLYSRTL